MDERTLGISMILVAVVSLTCAQLIIRTCLAAYGAVPTSPAPFLGYVIDIVQDWRAWLGGIGLIVSAVLWYAALSRLPLSVAFPFGALSYPLIFAGSVFILREDFSWVALCGNLLIVSGVVLTATR